MNVKTHLIDESWGSKGYFPIDLSVHNPYWDIHDVAHIPTFESYLKQQQQQHDAIVAYGGYLEQRALYRNNARFQEGAVRDIHLGIDLWAPAGTSVHALMDGVVHSFANHTDPGNYGPTVILEHDYDDSKLYSLYGHLTSSDLELWQVGKTIKKGELIAHLGMPHENGGYAPHLHFQIMTDMLDYIGDFPGVMSNSSKSIYKNIVLDPIPFIFR